MTDKQRNIPAISPVTKSAIYDAMLRSLKGYVSSVIDSVGFELSRALSSGEQQYFYHTVLEIITRSTCQTDRAEVNHG